MPRFSRFPVLAAQLLLAPTMIPAQAAPGTPAIDIRRTDAPPKIDGILRPGEWDGAAHTDALRMVEPDEGGVPTERTEFWVTYDPHHIYVAIRAHDSAGAAGVRAYSMQRDQDNGSDDLVRIVFDTFHRQNDGYYFALTAAGGKHDGLIQNKDQANDQWDAIWQGRSTIDAGGWTAEFAIPVKSLAFDPANDTWGFNVARAVRRKQEVMRWTGIFRNRPTIALPLLGDLRGITGLHQGRGLDFKPYASLTRHSDPAPGENEVDFKPGFDLIWQVTPSLAATLTVNTDFADAEVDERQVNLGRFSLFFPEKRAFFTQDASLFTFAGINQDPLPFFSRRIGLAEDGTKVDVLGGLKLTGRAGPWTLGLLDVQLDEHAGVDSKNLFAGRVARQVLDESSAGLIFTHGDPRIDGGNTLVGADFNYVNNRVLGEKSLTVRTAVQYTDGDYTGRDGTASTLAVVFPNEPYEGSFRFNRVDEHYDPALGFVSRTGIQQMHSWNRYRWYFDRKPVRRLDVFAEGDLVTDLNGRRLDRSLWLGGEAATPAGDYLVAFWQPQVERLDTPFAIRPGIVIPAGDHRWDRTHAELGTNSSRPVNLEIELHTGGFFTGRRHDYEAELGWRPSNRLELAGSFEFTRISLPQGRFDVRVASAKVVYTFSPDLQVSVLGQYDNLSAELGLNFRLKWIVQPGNEVFFIVNQGYDTSFDRFRPTTGDVSAKGAWTYRF
jgi:hypothetical protein